MNYADLIEAQEANRDNLGQQFADAGKTSREVTAKRRKAAEAAVKASQARAFEAAVEAALAKNPADEADTDGL